MARVRTEEKRDEIVKIAAELFEKHGFERCSMAGQARALGVQMLRLGHAARLEHAAMDDQELVSRCSQVLDDRAPDEARAAEDDDSQAVRTVIGLRSTIVSMRPHSLACSALKKKSRSIARSTSSSGRPVCFA